VARDTDILVIGAGSGGLSVAAGAVQMGARVTLVEGGAMGGDCLNHGCVPSKALLAAAAVAQSARSAARLGVTAAPVIDFAAVKDHVEASIAHIAPVDSQERFEGLGVRVVRGMARFAGPDSVVVGGQTITARRIVIATGSRPHVPAIPGLSRLSFLTNETIFGLRERPGHLLVVGGGPIGVEMAQAHVRLGVPVTLVTQGAVMGRDDPQAVAVLMARLRAEGITVIEHARITGVTGGDGDIGLALGDQRTIAGSHLLVATGRRVDLSALDPAAAGVAFTDRGVTVDTRLRTTNRRIFAVGDAAGLGQFTHLAGYHAGVVVRQAVLGLPAQATAPVPRVTYTDPELAQLGLTEAEARRAFPSVTVIRQEFHHNDRAVTEGDMAGFLKLMVHKGRPVGVTVVGAHAGDTLLPWTLALQAGVRLSTLAGMLVPYPTRGEIAKRAAGAVFAPKLFNSPAVKSWVGLVQRWFP
jgi:pyruvate/2-oxoglutarate dehydrogenase complex dihydrolipoamide dehydrogenase (E3) component